MTARLLSAALAVVTLTAFSHAQTGKSAIAVPANPTSSMVHDTGQTPNILFIIMDDVGIDQMQVFGYGGGTASATPNIDTIAHAGLRFRNVWAMPECSPSRAIYFEGRFPLRTNIYNAILSIDLANSQLSPYEVTTPNVLRTVGYSSALFGKFHLGGGSAVTNPYNPYGQGTPHAAGFDYFDGFLEGAPYPIDNTIGGEFPINHTNGSGPFSCGFVPAAKDGGADFGTCRFADGSCLPISKDATHPTPGRSCLEQGGLFVPKQRSCNTAPPSTLDFVNHANAYYVWYRVINKPDGTVVTVPLTDRNSRRYVSDVTTETAVNWINAQNAQQKPWMATVSYANIHSPYQQPPSYLLPPGEADASGLQCTGNSTKNLFALRNISNQMLEAMDTEIGQVMVKSGLATFNQDGSLNYQPEKTNTMVVIVGDNGTYAPSVKLPFDPNLSKGTVYQTGVWVPLIVAGPMVVAPDREVKAMINIADLFQLFGDFAGVDVHQANVDPHKIDSVAMLPYLTNPSQSDIRQSNFTQTQSNIHFENKPPPPCVIAFTQPASCVQIFPQQKLCEFEGGTWYGPGAPQVFNDCCAVANANPPGTIGLLPNSQMATRNGSYKLIQQEKQDCSTNQPYNTTEFYRIDELPVAPRIDFPQLALCVNDPSTNTQNCPSTLTLTETAAYNRLVAAMDNVVHSQPKPFPCPGDGNEDMQIDNLDVTDWQFYSTFNGGGSSWYDFNFDGFTNPADLYIIMHGTDGQQPFPRPCQ